jgi:hypothetical protein
VKTLGNEADRKSLLRRLHQLRQDSQRRWGTMSPHQMICHLNDSFKAGTGEKEVSSVSNVGSRTLVKWIALYLPIPWAHGMPTHPKWIRTGAVLRQSNSIVIETNSGR